MTPTHSFLLLLMLSPPVFRRRSRAVYRPSAKRAPAPARTPPPLPAPALPLGEPRHRPDTISESARLAGVPLRVLLSERAGPGALLRETLLIRPSRRDE